jgi:uncharacterized protein
MKHNDLLIVFIDNAKGNKLINSLSKDVQQDTACFIQQKIIEYTCKISTKVSFVDIAVFYSNKIISNDVWENYNCQKFLQRGVSLGERVKHAYYDCFNQGYNRIVSINSDILNISHEEINKAFDILHTGKSVIGGNTDGGIYLLGLNNAYPIFFDYKKWESNQLNSYLISVFKNYNHSFSLLESKHPIISIEDLDPYYEILSELNKKTIISEPTALTI